MENIPSFQSTYPGSQPAIRICSQWRTIRCSFTCFLGGLIQTRMLKGECFPLLFTDSYLKAAGAPLCPCRQPDSQSATLEWFTAHLKFSALGNSSVSVSSLLRFVIPTCFFRRFSLSFDSFSDWRLYIGAGCRRRGLRPFPNVLHPALLFCLWGYFRGILA